MASSTDTLIAEIDKLVEMKTFGLEALDAIKSLRDKVMLQGNKIEDLTRELQDQRTLSGTINVNLMAAKAEVDAWKKREADLVLREAKVSALELASAQATATLNGYTQAMSLVFRNTIVRENIQKTVPIAPMPGSGQTYPTSHTANEAHTTGPADDLPANY